MRTMLQTITTLKTVRNEPQKDYFTAVSHPGKMAFLERQQPSWQETLDYLHNYWNAGNLKGICMHLSKELRRKHFGSAAKIMNASSYMETLLLQRKNVLWQEETPAQVQGLISLVVLDRKMCRWRLTAYGNMLKCDKTYLLNDYCVIAMQRFKEAEQDTAGLHFGIIKLKQACNDKTQTWQTKGMPHCKKDGNFAICANEETHQKIIVKDEIIICCAADKCGLHKLLRLAINSLRLEEMRVCTSGGGIIINEI